METANQMLRYCQGTLMPVLTPPLAMMREPVYIISDIITLFYYLICQQTN